MDRYRRHYGYTLLDDIHNLFPDLLYREGTMSPEFQYIRNQTRALFPIRYMQGTLEYQTVHSMDPLHYVLAILQPSRRDGLHDLLSMLEELEPVVVRPTPEQITRATSISPHTEVEASAICAICQDHACPESTTDWREIESCGHLYHKKCIDRWIETSVKCPICRIDIREAPSPP